MHAADCRVFLFWPGWSFAKPELLLGSSTGTWRLPSFASCHACFSACFTVPLHGPPGDVAGIMDELAKEYGFSYEVAKADIDEKAIRHEDAQHLVLRLAHAKAAAIAAKLEAAEGPGRTGLLITCDQVGPCLRPQGGCREAVHWGQQRLAGCAHACQACHVMHAGSWIDCYLAQPAGTPRTKPVVRLSRPQPPLP